MEKMTALYETHIKAGGKMVNFAGYMLPIQYKTGVIKEHMAVREAAGLFDVSHMGELILKGVDAVRNLNKILTNDYTVMDVGQARYSPMCNEAGGCIDDLIVYKYSEDVYFIVVNASNKDKDYSWICNHISGSVTCEDRSESIGQIALQGPKSKEIMLKITDDKFIPKKYYHGVFDALIGDIKCLISRTGYTGEFGYEIYCDAEKTTDMWDIVMAAGKSEGLIPCGLGARDTLRLEASMPLYGHEMDDTITPLETGLDFAVKTNKLDFIGKSAMIKISPARRQRIGLKVTGRGIIREHEAVLKDGELIGYTTSGTHAPYLGYPIAMAIIQSGKVNLGDQILVEVRGRQVEAEIVSLPFYNRVR